jgi:dephospho-CoA kinase
VRPGSFKALVKISMRKLKIGVTGGIGAGKSELSKFYVDKGETVIIADDVAKNLLNENKEIQNEIIDEFGAEAFDSGKMNVKYLAEKVFTNEKNVKKINSIVHPAAIKEIDKLMNECLKNSDLVFCESALIYEAGMEEMFDYILTVSAAENIRISRVADRDKSSKEDVKMRMINQMSEEQKKQLSDFIIYNDSSITDLHTKAEFFLNLFKTICTSES